MSGLTMTAGAVGTVLGVSISGSVSLTPIAADDVAAWAAGGESELLELKATTGQREEAAKALCGMLNGNGGRVVFGVTPGGEIVGQQVSDKTLEDLAATIRGIKPEVQPHVEKIPLGDNTAAIVVTALPGRVKPYLYRGSAYRRVGAATVKMTADEQQRLLLEQVHTPTRFELEPSPLSVDNIDTKALRSMIEAGIVARRIDDRYPDGRNTGELLMGLALLTAGRLNHAGAILFGDDRTVELHYPQCVAKLAVFRGSTVTDLAEVRQVHGNAFTLIEAAETFIDSRLPIRSELIPGQLRRQDTPELPPLAIREALANALAHRDYHTASGSISVKIFDDRVEITSIGTLHFGLRPEQLYVPHEARPWNPVIAQILYRSGIAESVGTGTLRMVDHTRDAGLPAPVITSDNQAVKVTFTRPGFPPPTLAALRLTAEQTTMIQAIRQLGNSAAHGELVDETGIATRRARLVLDSLRELGLAELTGERRWAKWHLAGVARDAYGLSGLNDERQ